MLIMLAWTDGQDPCCLGLLPCGSWSLTVHAADEDSTELIRDWCLLSVDLTCWHVLGLTGPSHMFLFPF